MSTLYYQVRLATEYLEARIAQRPAVGLVLGSGLSAVAERLAESQTVSYAEIPEFPESTVAGHPGRLVLGYAGEICVAALQGRFHYYEGHSLAAVTLPIRVLAALGARILILTAAAGAIRATLRAGDLVSLCDHINLLGDNPLRGVNDPRLGPRFPDLSEVYSKRLRAMARSEAARLGISLDEGVYAAMPGPSYETPAEIRMLRALGADVVGMSTVPEAIVARQAGMEVLALALVTNKAAGLIEQPLSHEEVLAAAALATEPMARLILAVAARCQESA